MAKTLFSDGDNVTNNVQDKPEKKHRYLKPLLVILAVILLVGVTGFGVWWWQNGELNKQRTDSDKQISALQKQVNDLKKSDSSASATTTTPTNPMLTNEQIFQEVSTQLGFTRSDINSFKIYGQDKVIYSGTPPRAYGIYYVYKQTSKWKIAVADGMSLDSCSGQINVPDNYKAPCEENGQAKYVDSSNRSTNYPPSQEINYIVK